jgi:hypothetical protein
MIGMENHDDDEPGGWSEDFARYLAIEQQPRFRDLDLHVSFDPDLAWPLLL